MQSVSATWIAINEYLDHNTSWKVVIGDDTYLDENIQHISITRPLFDSFSIGGVCASKLEVTLDPNSLSPVGVIPNMATLTVYAQISYGASVSEWLKKGVFYVDTRETMLNGMVQLTCYDVMLKTEQFWYNGPSWSWPTNMRAALTDLTTRIGTPLDSRNPLTTFTSYSVSKDYDLTLRDVLSYIAIAHGGNWFVSIDPDTDEPALRFVTLSDIPPETNLLATEAGAPIVFGEVRIVL